MEPSTKKQCRLNHWLLSILHIDSLMRYNVVWRIKEFVFQNKCPELMEGIFVQKRFEKNNIDFSK